MFYHVKELQFNARVSKPDPAFATLLLEQFGGANGELAAALRYFGQAFGAKKPYPDKYDLLMDIATEEFSHLEIVGATIQMLLTGINGDLKKAADESEIMRLLDGKASKEEMIHQDMVAPQFLVGSGGTPCYTNSQGVPWTAAYINGDAQGDLTADLRSDIGAETRAKMVYEYLLQFTNDPYVKETLRFLMTREVAHYQMFEAALATIQPNFPPGTLQADPRYSNLYFNMSTGNNYTGPWNEGTTTQTGETLKYIEDPIAYVMETNGLLNQETDDNNKQSDGEDVEEQLGKQRSEEVNMATSMSEQQWNDVEMEEKIASKITQRNVEPIPGEDASVTAQEAKSKKSLHSNGTGSRKRK
ncbi:MAG TPA: manganese catalase family protein [Parafilimonas sp.]|nr:manganese catalase family protein [Parafilimonas sp.]